MAKTLKLKKPEPTLTAKPAAPGAEPPKEGEAAPAAPAEEGQQGIYVSSRHRNPLEAAAAAGPVKKERWAWAAILAIITLAIFATLVYIEWADMYMLRYA